MTDLEMLLSLMIMILSYLYFKTKRELEEEKKLNLQEIMDEWNKQTEDN